ncbi:ABC transporter permease [Mucilaginibacter aquatilis]|uniref:FtsX-like permease family protein n=1 Tax=Mucilaginibacter aquatilis TaxID=1517760 RepID=A0A6I4I8L0_9SPHI|nr:ABC transporter permease [Mucilaginibacter aquatilis]MVN91550.1 FtsX-like permease family protein [Mucilaginibacter aquatilis]
MTNLSIKIAFRSFLKSKVFYLLNIAGLAIGLAAFILVSLFIDNETSYDKWNKNFDRVYLVERELPNGPSPFTPGKLAAAIKDQCPEVDETGRITTALFQIPFFTKSRRFLIKKWIGADYSISKILGIKPKGFVLNANSSTPAMLLSKETAEVLFPGDSLIQNKSINMMSRSGMAMPIAGIAEDFPGNTNLKFDCIAFSADITSGKDQTYATQIYQTYILVKPSTDIALLSSKIDNIYKRGALADTSQVAKEAIRRSDRPAIYLDPLKNLHLKPHYGSHVNNQIVISLGILAIVILIITAVNFTNLYISQADARSKEVGIKKVNGVVGTHIALQFILEIFFQCLLALVLSFVLVCVTLPYFNKILQTQLLLTGVNAHLIIQLIITLLVLTLLAGTYPAIVMAGFKPIEVLRGSQLAKQGRLSYLPTIVTLLQFTVAITFVITLVIVNQQVTYMKSENPGFTAKQVLYIDNLSLFNDPKKFGPVRDRIKDIPGVKAVTVASNIPGGIMPATHDYLLQGRPYALNTIAVDYEYFETLNIKLAAGQTFNAHNSGDSANALINEAAAQVMNLKGATGIIEGCSGKYRIVGIIKNVKAYGFEEITQPTIYLMKDHCGISKTQIMISVENNRLPAVIKTLNKNWPDINKLDGDNFNYHFLDELYEQLFVKQEQLQAVLVLFSVLAVLIAALGFFSLAAQAIRVRMKETTIRKVLGANTKQLMITLSRPFFYIVLSANCVAWPLAFLVAHGWLETFAYRVHINIYPFLIALITSVVIVVFTVSFQINRAIKFKPTTLLKD